MTSEGSAINDDHVANNVPDLQAKLKLCGAERDDLRRQLEAAQRDLAALAGSSADAEVLLQLRQENDHLRKTLKKATDMLRDKITALNAQDKRNSALTQQISSLKDVLQVTRDLLNIRNLEVEELQKNVDTMESRIEDNRRRQTAMIKQIELATKINGELRNEYETQLKLFQSLKERYEEKVEKLTKMAKDRNELTTDATEPTAESEAAPQLVNVTEPNAATLLQTETEVSSHNAEQSSASQTIDVAAEDTTSQVNQTETSVESLETDVVTQAVEVINVLKAELTEATKTIDNPETTSVTEPKESTNILP